MNACTESIYIRAKTIPPPPTHPQQYNMYCNSCATIQYETNPYFLLHYNPIRKLEIGYYYTENSKVLLNEKNPRVL